MTAKLLTHLWPASKYGLILFIIFCLALLLRVLPRLDDVFGWGWVRFGEVDPWYHIRLLENLLQHFPHQITFDPYTYFPWGQEVAFAPFFDLMLGTVLWIFGLGSPSVEAVETAAAYYPAVLGALTVIPVYFTGRALFDRKAGIIAAAVIAVLPGNFLARSLLGVTDHHAAETLLSTVSALFLILAVKNSREKISFVDLRSKAWTKIKKPLIYALLCGLFLGLYIDTWVGGLLFVLIIFVYFFIQFIIDHLMGRSTGYLCLIGVPAFLIALILIIPFLGQGGLSIMYPLSLGFSIAALAALAGLSWLLEKRRLKRVYFLLAAVGAVLAAAGIVYAVTPDLFIRMVRQFGIFLPQGGSMTISEVQSVFSRFESLTQNMIWGFFTTGLFTVPIAIILLAYGTVKQFKAEHLFLLCWSILMLAAMAGQNRFSYYFAVNVAVLDGYLCWKIYGWISALLKLPVSSEPRAALSAPGSRKRKKEADGRKQDSPAPAYLKKKYLATGLLAVISFLLVIYPNISPSIEIASVNTGPNQDWRAALLWMKDNTPEPFEDPHFFNAIYKAPPDTPERRAYPYPASAYGIMCAWDYGHWITQIARRIPNANPHQFGAYNTARFFTAQDEPEGNAVMNELGSRYVIMDITAATSMFVNHGAWLGQSNTRYIETVYQVNAAGKLEPVTVYYPEYYRSMSTRLYNFKGEAVVPQNTSRVITCEDKIDSSGKKYKRIIFSKLFATYEEAEAYCLNNPKSKIISSDPFISPVPLEKLEHYSLVYGSENVVNRNNDRKISYVQIFEYKP